MKRILTVLVALIVICCLSCAIAEKDVLKPVTSITPVEKNIVLAVDTAWQAEVVIGPENATNRAVGWTSTNEKVATVDENGVITGRGKGKCNINVTALDGSKKKASISVQVKEYDVVLRYPMETDMYFDTTDDYAEYEVGAFGNVRKTVYQRTVTFNGGVVESAGNHKLRPVKAGEGTVEVVEKENGKVKQKVKATVYVAQSAVAGDIIVGTEDLARGRDAQASSEVPALWRYYANDGDTESYWESQGYPAEFVIDLGGKADVSSVGILMGQDWGARSQTIGIYSSEDGSEYRETVAETEYQFDQKHGNRVFIGFERTSARYVKLVFVGGTWQNAQAAEITVNGIRTEDAAPVEDVNVPSAPDLPDFPDFDDNW